MDSQVLLHVPPENPNPGPNDISTEMNPKSTMSANIAMLPTIIRKPTICAVSFSDFSMTIFSRTYDTTPLPAVEDTIFLRELLAKGSAVCSKLPESLTKKTVFSVFIPKANANQTIELRILAEVVEVNGLPSPTSASSESLLLVDIFVYEESNETEVMMSEESGSQSLFYAISGGVFLLVLILLIFIKRRKEGY